MFKLWCEWCICHYVTVHWITNIHVMGNTRNRCEDHVKCSGKIYIANELLMLIELSGVQFKES